MVRGELVGVADPEEGRLIELVASFANRSNLLKSWEKTDTCEVSSYGAHGLKKRSDHAHARPMLCHGVPRIFLTVPLSYGAIAYTVAKARNVCAP
jgi:hypothetical protein